MELVEEWNQIWQWMYRDDIKLIDALEYDIAWQNKDVVASLILFILVLAISIRGVKSGSSWTLAYRKDDRKSIEDGGNERKRDRGKERENERLKREREREIEREIDKWIHR